MEKALTLDNRYSELKSSPLGLTGQEAKDRLNHYGPNTLRKESNNRIVKQLLKQFKSSLILLLLVASIISLFLSDYSDAIVIAVILLINTGLGFFQEYKSEKAIDNLQKLVSKQVLVIRDGVQQLINEKLLVPGDVIVLKEGDSIAADAQLIRIEDFSVNESSLSGESVGVVKSLKNGQNLVFAGCSVEQGEATAIVFATGNNTRLGSIAKLSTDTHRITQYEKSLAQFSSFLIKVTFITLIFVFITKLAINGNFHALGALLLFMIVLSIAVVPEAMPVIATVTLSKGALKLAKKHVIAKTLTAVEDLGNINVLCSDKTGTLTENHQSVKHLIADDKQLFMHLAIASLETSDIKHHLNMSSFDQALVNFIPVNIQQSAKNVERLEELPFDPLSRRRRVVFRERHKTYIVEVGSVETLLELCSHPNKKDYLETIKEDGASGLRHLGIAYKEINYDNTKQFDIKEHEKDLDFVGFVALEDKLRPSAKRTIATARKLGVDIKILSGDSREVTAYVAKEVGLIDEDEVVYIGDEIAKMSDLSLAKTLQTHSAFARLTPEQKHRIINVLKLQGNVVGYQGDGINDAPSLKLADVAIAVDHATDVARDSSDILLLSSDLGVVINGIKYGRGIFANINKYIRYTMIGNFGNFFALSALFLLNASLPLLTLQLLLTNLLGDLPLIAISTDNVDPKSLLRPSHYSMHSLISISIILGSFTAIFEVLFFALLHNRPLGVEQTSLFLYLTYIGFIVIVAVRNREHFYKAVRMSMPLKLAFSIIALITIAVVYFPPTQKLFSFSSLSISILIQIAVLTLIYFFLLDIIKVWFYRTPLANRIE